MNEIGLRQWAKDHASTLLYAEARAVDHGGHLDERNLRGRDSGYPTRLKGENGELVERPDYGDHEILEDMDRANLLDYRRGAGLVRLTALGWTIAGMLRRNRAEGVRDCDFDWERAYIRALGIESLDAAGVNGGLTEVGHRATL